MTGAAERFSPGSLVALRGREWIVLPGSDAETLRLRPLAGGHDDRTVVHLPLEVEPARPAHFTPPTAERHSGQDAALLLRDALLLSLRRGAGPFRSFGGISVDPRSYQLVPLLMALKLDPVRLLIADDVGIGKTIEGGLIARELLDRGEIRRFAVLCPPYLVDQWVRELDRHFHLKAEAVTANSAARLERGLPVGTSTFEQYPFTVVSLDYIKADRRRDEFARACPELVIVDEAHTCTLLGQGRQQRYELLKRLAGHRERHLILLTATPHSGNEDGFHRLLGLLDPKFEGLGEAHGARHEQLREQLVAHFVQRRRPDIEAWQHERVFAKRETKEVTYRLGGEWRKLFDAVLAYCADVTTAAGVDERRQRLTFWGTLALMRCVSSSPGAAALALRTRSLVDAAEADEEMARALELNATDGVTDDMPEADTVAGAPVEDPRLAGLVAHAERLAGDAGDPKLKALGDELAPLVKDGFAPIVFCRYVATAHYVAAHLEKRFKDVEVGVVTGELAAEERAPAVAELGKAKRRLLVATDCLSEGINLQDWFDAVVHYDLSWNPTRHEQREGRVDRYGQQSPVVRAILLWGEDNEIDAAVLDVILRKAERIRRDLGVPVPIPDEGGKLTQALMRRVLGRRTDRRQEWFDFAGSDEARKVEAVWRDAAEKTKRNRTIFAQRSLKPEEVMPEWERMRAALGSPDEVRRFVAGAMGRLNAAIAPRAGGGFDAPLVALPDDVRERLESEGLEGVLQLDVARSPARGCRHLHRSHPLVGTLADTLLERALGANGNAADPAVLGRCGAWIAEGVTLPTTIVLLRLRHQLTYGRGRDEHVMLVEEATAIGLVGREGAQRLDAARALALLSQPPAGELAAGTRQREIGDTLRRVAAAQGPIDEVAKARAEALLADHRRARDAAGTRGSYAVKALLPADVVGVWLLMPKV